MPLRDHFQPPLEDDIPWPSLFSAWGVTLATHLNKSGLPDEYVAYEVFKIRSDAGAYQRCTGPATSSRPGWEVPPPGWTVPYPRHDHVELHIREKGRWAESLPAAVAFVIPPQKESSRHRRAFLSRCASHLALGSALAIIDIVTHRPGCLFNDLLTVLGIEEVPRMPSGTTLFAAAFRPVVRDWYSKERRQMEVWAAPLAVGEPLPTLPLRIDGDQFAPVDFEAAYEQTCRDYKVL